MKRQGFSIFSVLSVLGFLLLLLGFLYFFARSATTRREGPPAFKVEVKEKPTPTTPPQKNP